MTDIFRSPVKSIVFIAVMMMTGVVAAYTWSQREPLLELWHKAYQQRYLVMAGEVGPVTYLVYHDDYQQLEAFAFESEEVLGVEPYQFPDIAAMAFTGREASAIAAVDQLPEVRRMVRRKVPMLCH